MNKEQLEYKLWNMGEVLSQIKSRITSVEKEIKLICEVFCK